MSDLVKNLLPSNRGKKQKIRKSNKRKLSSTNWIKRQINDHYVIEANKLGFNYIGIINLSFYPICTR